MYKCKHFKIQELVSKGIYEKFGETAWEFIDEKLAITLDQLREKFGRIVVNDWNNRGTKQWRGFRTPDSADYSPTSQHAHGRGADCITLDCTVEFARQYILAHPEEFPFIGGVELGVSWLHIDTRNHDGIKTFGRG